MMGQPNLEKTTSEKSFSIVTLGGGKVGVVHEAGLGETFPAPKR